MKSDSTYNFATRSIKAIAFEDLFIAKSHLGDSGNMQI